MRFLSFSSLFSADLLRRSSVREALAEKAGEETAMATAMAAAAASRQGLTFVHFSAQPELLLTQNKP